MWFLNSKKKLLYANANCILINKVFVKLQLCRTCFRFNNFMFQDACVSRPFYAVLEEIQSVRPEFKVRLGGYMNARDMCKAVAKTTQANWLKDPTLVFINFIEERKIKIFDLFKQFDKDRSCTLTREEFITGLSKIGCPLDNKQLIQLLHTLDVDSSGEIDLM